jgi:hypothetical protein
MHQTTTREIAAPQRLTMPQLRLRYAEVFGEETNANNRAWLVKRLAGRLQALAEGDLSQRARQRAAELANDADLRMNAPMVKTPTPAAERTQTFAAPFRADARLPLPGTILTRVYKGRPLQVQVLDNGFAYDGQVYGSLSAVAKAITGSHCNGFLFFRLHQNGGAA